MNRVLGWLRAVRSWLVSWRRCRDLERQVAHSSAVFAAELARRGRELFEARATIAELLRECESLYALWRALDADLARERQWGNVIAGRLGKADAFAGELPPEQGAQLRLLTRPQMTGVPADA